MPSITRQSPVIIGNLRAAGARHSSSRDAPAGHFHFEHRTLAWAFDEVAVLQNFIASAAASNAVSSTFAVWRTPPGYAGPGYLAGAGMCLKRSRSSSVSRRRAVTAVALKRRFSSRIAVRRRPWSVNAFGGSSSRRTRPLFSLCDTAGAKQPASPAVT